MGWPGPMTHRQFAVWQMWLEMELDRPTKTEQYLMQIAAEVRRTAVKDPKKVELKHMRLKFNNLDETSMSEEQRDQLELARWTAQLGGANTIRIIPPEDVWMYEAAEELK